MEGGDKATLDERKTRSEGGFLVPGVAVVFSGGYPLFRFGALRNGILRLGRGDELGLAHDAKLSRDHAELAFDGQNWKVTDLDSKNGTFVDGERIDGKPFIGHPTVIRLGQTLVLPLDDGTDALTWPLVQDNGLVTGSKLRKALRDVKRAAEAGQTLLLSGEMGSGKELAVRAFHAAFAHRKGPLVSVDCATLGKGTADRLLFGVKRGAYPEATADVAGHVQSAEGGVLFLDELSALELDVQEKLLRVLDSREMTPPGASSAQPVDVRFCFGSHRDLRAAVAGGTLRADFLERIARPEARLPPLRERLEEMPWHAAAEVERAAPALRASAEFLEACMLRQWPGNVSEFLAEMRRAGHALLTTSSRLLRPEHLLPSAGMPPRQER